jgi:hypothetical protein
MFFMLRLNEIQENLKQVVGWEQSFCPDTVIDDALTETESGLYFQGAHPLVTIENINSVKPEELELSAYLERFTRNGINSVIQTFEKQKKLDRETKSLLERTTLFDGAGRLQETIQNNGYLCGYEIVPVRSMGVTVKIERIGLQMTGAEGTVMLYLFHSNNVEPYWTQEFEIQGGKGTFQWFPVKDLFLPYVSDKNNAGGAWYLCYNQNDLPRFMTAINISKDWSREPTCGGCNSGNVETWRELTKYIRVSPFKTRVSDDFQDAPELWDADEMIYTNTSNWGINVELTVGCDLTDFIISQRHIFRDVIQKETAMKVLRELAMNPDARINRKQSNAQNISILYEIDGDSRGRPGGLSADLKEHYKALNLETKGLDRVCLCEKNKGVIYTSI